MKRVIIIPMEGLCNRMRVIASGVFIARKIGAQPIVYWNKTAGCNCRFDNLFEPISQDICEMREGRGVLHHIASKYNLWIPLILRKLRYGQVIRCFDINSMGDIFPLIKDVESLVLESHSKMAPYFPINSLFTPTGEILSCVNETTRTFDSNVIGIHIRRTDNALSLKHSPLPKFVDIMNAAISENPCTRFFLATDDLATRESLTREFGSRIIYRENVLERNSEAGMKDAVIDLYCLSRTCKIVGSYWSSYSGMAAEIGGLELIIA